MDGGIVIGLIALAAVWIYSSSKVQAAAISSNPLSPQGIAATGLAVGAAGAGLGSLATGLGNLFGTTSYQAGGVGVAGQNTGAGPLGGQTWSNFGATDTPVASSGSVQGPSFSDTSFSSGGSGALAGGPDGGDTGLFNA